MRGDITIVGALVLSSICFAQAVTHWPRVRPEDKSFHVSLPAADPGVKMAIKDQSGREIYEIACGTYATPFGAFDYSGEFECMLQSIPSSSYSTLFTEYTNQDRDWESRARFFANEIAPPCGEIPDFGLNRTFRLRGMKVTLAMSNVVFSGHGKEQKIKSFRFNIKVAQDPAANTPITQPPLLNKKWKRLPCTLDDSVKVHFRASATTKEP